MEFQCVLSYKLDSMPKLDPVGARVLNLDFKNYWDYLTKFWFSSFNFLEPFICVPNLQIRGSGVTRNLKKKTKNKTQEIRFDSKAHGIKELEQRLNG